MVVTDSSMSFPDFFRKIRTDAVAYSFHKVRFGNL